MTVKCSWSDVIITQRFYVTPDQANQDFFLVYWLYFKSKFFSIIYVQATRMPPRDFPFLEESLQGQIKKKKKDSGGQQYCRDNSILNNSHVLNTKLQVSFMVHKILMFNLFTTATWVYTTKMDVRCLKSILSMRLHVCVTESKPRMCQAVTLLLVYIVFLFPGGITSVWRVQRMLISK